MRTQLDDLKAEIKELKEESEMVKSALTMDQKSFLYALQHIDGDLQYAKEENQSLKDQVLQMTEALKEIITIQHKPFSEQSWMDEALRMLEVSKKALLSPSLDRYKRMIEVIEKARKFCKSWKQKTGENPTADKNLCWDLYTALNALEKDEI